MVISLLLLALSTAQALNIQLPFLSNPNSISSALAPQPFTGEWARAVEFYYNVRGHKKNDSECPVPIPKFKCDIPTYDEEEEENENILKRDAWHLRPRDIKAVITLGDSISTGFAMLSGRPPLASMLEYRGKVFSIGGDENELTIANFLAAYSPNLRGAPTDYTAPFSIGKGLNDAVSGSIAGSLKYQVDRLVEQMQTEFRDVKRKWKLITILIGANDVCEACVGDKIPNPLSQPDVFEKELRQTLNKLRKEVGYAFVNIVGLFNVSNVYLAAQNDSYCKFLFEWAHLNPCRCASDNVDHRNYADELTREYNRRMRLVASEFSNATDFAVVVQPGLMDIDPTKYGQAFLSGLDCFHPNHCAQKVMAVAIWNNMLSPVSEKRQVDAETLDIYCPGPYDVIQ
ncbi:uncharacterized protein VTP21DRAFT_1949 [Calcarisporiella thermophila]|uniref:uncharacterized protein n=1 Tax=Calcarisporiella thermophila TaxID=911321 RepID=UPI003742C88F